MANPPLIGLRVLVLDGGDIRSLSQLSILNEFLVRVQWARKREDVLFPCEYFDMICGTGPAGIIVILLVVFRMSVEEAKDEFVRIWEAVFADDSFEPSERSLRLESIIEKLLTDRIWSTNRKLQQAPTDGTCKGFVCAVSPCTPTVCQKFRTYSNPQSNLDISIVEAIRVTCAAPDRFISVRVNSPPQAVHSTTRDETDLSDHDKQEFIAGDDILQNPTREAIKELYEIYGRDMRVACVLSLGSGRPSTMHIDKIRENRSNGLWVTAALQAERVAEELEAQIGGSQVYYRFSVDRGLESPDIISLNHLGEIEAYTSSYLQQTKTSREMLNCTRVSEEGTYVSVADLYCAPTRGFAATHGLPPLSASFVIRREVMDSMAHCLFDSDGDSQKIIILSGMGGSGKTQLISKFARTYLNRFRHILFIDARTSQSIKKGIISRVRSLGGICTTVKEALDFLADMDPTSSGPWFIILDNADDLNIDLASLIPNCDHGFIAITTRNPAVGDLNPRGHIKLDVMTQDEALQALLCTIFTSIGQVSEDDRITGLAIVTELGFLPVAIVQAGSYIKHQIRGPMSNYLAKLKTHRQRLLSIPAKFQRDGHFHAVYATLDVTLEVLSPAAKNLLGVLSSFNYTGFPLSLIDQAVDRRFLYQPFDLFDRPAEFQETAQFLTQIFSPLDLPDLDVVAELEQYSLVVRVENYSIITLRFHPLVHAWMVDRIASQDNKKFWDAALRLLVCGTAEENEDLYEYLCPQLEVLSPSWDKAHKNDIAAVARLRSWEEDRAGALGIWNIIHRETRRVYGQMNFRSSIAKLQLALAYCAASAQQQALAAIEEVIATRSQLLSPDHPDTLLAICSLSEIKLADPLVKILDKDISRQLEVVERLQQYAKVDFQLLLLRAKEVLSKMYQLRAQWVDAETLLLEVLQARVRTQGAKHWMALRSKQLLAYIYYERERQKDSRISVGSEPVVLAEQLLKELVTARMTSKGPYRVDTLKAQQSLAELYELTGRYNLAETAMQQLVEGYKVARGPHNRQTLDCMKSLAGLYEKSNRNQEAVAQWLETIEYCRAMHDYVQVEESMKNLARQLEKMEQFNDGTVLVDKVLMTSKMNGDKSEAQVAMMSRARLLERIGRHHEAVAEWIQVLQTCESMDDNSGTISATNSLAQLFRRLVVHDQVINRCDHKDKREGMIISTHATMASLTELLDRVKRHSGALGLWARLMTGAGRPARDARRQVIDIFGSLVELLELIGQLNDAVIWRKQLIQELNAAGDRLDAQEGRKELVELLSEIGNISDAALCQEQLVDEYKKMGYEGSARIVIELLYRLRERQRMHNKAIARWEGLISQLTATPSAFDSYEDISALTRLLEKMGRWDEATIWWQRLIRERQLNGDKEGARSAMKYLADLFERMGRFDGAVAWWEQVVEEYKAAGDNKKARKSMKYLAHLLEQIKRFGEAEFWWWRLIEECNAAGATLESYGAMRAMAELLQRMKRHDEAVTSWGRLITFCKEMGDNQELDEAMWSLAQLFVKIGRSDDAQAWQRMILMHQGLDYSH